MYDCKCKGRLKEILFSLFKNERPRNKKGEKECKLRSFYQSKREVQTDGERLRKKLERLCDCKRRGRPKETHTILEIRRVRELQRIKV